MYHHYFSNKDHSQDSSDSMCRTQVEYAGHSQEYCEVYLM